MTIAHNIQKQLNYPGAFLHLLDRKKIIQSKIPLCRNNET